MGYKLSNYNYYMKKEDGYTRIFNSLSGSIIELEESLIENLSDMEKKTLDRLVKSGFVLSEDIDEIDYIKSISSMARFSDNSFKITLVPTLACNFRCTYCFEKRNDYPNVVMGEEVITKVIELINKNTNDYGSLSVSWFGGEPLLEMGIIKRAQSDILKLVEKKKLIFNSSIITNGYLLNRKISDELVDMKINMAQITIDGSKQIHDSMRFLKNGAGTFDKIIGNLKEINSNLALSIRVNVDKNNINSIDSLISELKNIGFDKRRNINIYFSKITDSFCECSQPEKLYDDKEFSLDEINLYEKIVDNGFKFNRIPNSKFYICGAVSPKSMLIEPDGTIQKCWNCVGDKKKSVGNILIDEGGYNDNLYKWIGYDALNNMKCIDCKELPICMGGCPFDKIYNSKFECTTSKYNIDKMLSLFIDNM